MNPSQLKKLSEYVNQNIDDFHKSRIEKIQKLELSSILLRKNPYLFWYFISGDKNLYTDIIEPIGYEAKKHNDLYEQEKVKIVNKFTEEFMKKFCDEGVINWEKLVVFNSGNLEQPESPAAGRTRKPSRRTR